MQFEETSWLHEIFSAIQGEGMLVGLRQIFLRFHGCNLACAFCDTPASRAIQPSLCSIEKYAGVRILDFQSNPMSVSSVVEVIRCLQVGYPHHSVSLTGGEPLLHVHFLNELLPALRFAGLSSFLETNGTLADAFSALQVVPDYVAMDIKLPSATGLAPCWNMHAAFLATAVARFQSIGECSMLGHMQIKVVFSEHSLDDVVRAAELIAACHPALPCILQPLTPHPSAPPAPSVATVLEAQRLAACVLKNVRVIPQTHVIMKQW